MPPSGLIYSSLLYIHQFVWRFTMFAVIPQRETSSTSPKRLGNSTQPISKAIGESSLGADSYSTSVCYWNGVWRSQALVRVTANSVLSAAATCPIFFAPRVLIQLSSSLALKTFLWNSVLWLLIWLEGIVLVEGWLFFWACCSWVFIVLIWVQWNCSIHCLRLCSSWFHLQVGLTNLHGLC
jgi:hypothetical protein